VEQAAISGNPERFALPRPMLGRADANFSLSGLKTAVRQVAERHTPLTGDVVNDLCAGFQAAVIDSTVDRLKMSLKLFGEQLGVAPTALVAAGGVAANAAIRAALDGVAADAGLPLLLPPPALCTDNGAMIAWAGAERLALGLTDPMTTAPRARWRLDDDATVPAHFANTRANF
jgi:N6-L-threonylcarbamoyladenine synthase